MSRVRWKPLLLSLVPGWGHLYYRRFVAGVSLFVAFMSGVNGLFLLSLVYGDVAQPWGWAASALAIGSWGLSVAWVARHVLFRDPAAVERAREALIQQGLIHLLRSEYTEAIRCFRQANRIGPEAVAVDALFFLGATYRRMGDVQQARRWLRRLAAWDTEGKWRFELERERAAIEGKRTVLRAGAGDAARTATIRLPLESWAVGEKSGASPRLRGGHQP